MDESLCNRKKTSILSILLNSDDGTNVFYKVTSLMEAFSIKKLRIKNTLNAVMEHDTIYNSIVASVIL